ncbi:hypothetical protein AHF37_06347 [Paragonimus kellicotti]|nr:hypothetical protein AHF37_06347 [Paragonimus kellicotti]
MPVAKTPDEAVPSRSSDTLLSPSEDTYITVLYEYTPQHPDEIELRLGDKLKLLSCDHRDSGDKGWWVGQEPNNGRIGVFPSAYVSIGTNAVAVGNGGDVPSIADGDMEDQVFLSNENQHEFCPRSIADPSVKPDNCSNTLSDLGSSSPHDSMSHIHSPPVLPVELDQQLPLIDSSEIDQQQLKFIGCGAFGTVYQGQWHGKAVALKVLNFVANQLLVKEASHLCQLVHPNIVQFYGVCELGVHNTPAIVMEFAHGGPFNRLLADHPSLDPTTLLEWAGQIARGMAYLHSDVRLLLVKEASHLCQLVHPNIVQFYGVCELGVHNTPAIVMEFAHGGPFNRLLADHPSLDPTTLLEWAGQIARGMAYLHSDVRLVHRDLKSSNILIREPLTKPYVDQELRRCTLLITDFGMACRSSELIVSQQSKLGTVAYAAPEVCRQVSSVRPISHSLFITICASIDFRLSTYMIK